MSLELRLTELLTASIRACQQQETLPTDLSVPTITIETPKQAEHGDFATSIALALAKAARKSPRQVGEAIVAQLPADPLIRRAELAGPGFINFTIDPQWYCTQLAAVLAAGKHFGTNTWGQGRRCMVEFVSANPTGPLHVGHGRNAIYGDVVGNVLRANGIEVVKEYYVNDAGVQMRTLGRSVWLRLRELAGEAIEFPAECYQGAYIIDLAREVVRHPDWPQMHVKSELEQITWCGQYAGDRILQGIKDDLSLCGVESQNYFFETTLHQRDAVNQALAQLATTGHSYEQDGALWFRSTAFGDEKDRVLRKSDGQFTYFAADIAYHAEKFARGFDWLIDVWGADHAGHVPRLTAAITALGQRPDQLDCILIQMVNLMRGGEMVNMSTRSGEFETLADLVRQVGRDVARYFYLMRSHNAQLDFDLELATAQTMENPVFYLQYAHARICSIFAKATETGMPFDPATVPAADLLLPEELQLAKVIGEYPEVVATAGRQLEPHRVPFYLLELARRFQAYYTLGKKDARYRVLGQPAATGQAKLSLLMAIRLVLHNGLALLGISAPERMDRTTDTDGE